MSLDSRSPDEGAPVSSLSDATSGTGGSGGNSAGSPKRWIYPLIVIAAGWAVYALLVATREKPVTQDFVPPAPLVRVETISLQSVLLNVSTRGTVKPRTESDLVAEVSGRIVSVAPSLVVGGFFSEGDELLRLDDREYRIARDRARANVSLRESETRLSESEAGRRRKLAEQGAASSADLDQFENRERVARAALAEARGELEKAKLDLERTVVRAAFEGRVREREVDVGQFVTPGTKLGRIFAVDYAEVRLPIQTDDLAYLEGAFGRRSTGQAVGEASEGLGGASVTLTGRLGGRDYHWKAQLARAEAAIDERTRMLHVVARVENPYGLPVAERAGTAPGSVIAAPRVSGTPGETAVPAAPVEESIPLPSGLFVRAEIEGRRVEGVAVLPLMALRDGDQVFVFERSADSDPEVPPNARALPGTNVSGSEGTPKTETGHLRLRTVSVLRRDRKEVVIEKGLQAGDRVVVSPLRIYSEGMRLRALEVQDS